jgi:hypothetical protein
MPRLPIDYANTVIYKLVSNDLDFKSYYVGHTTDMVRRKQHHKYACNDENNPEHNTKKYKMIREKGGWDCWSMIEIEKYPCKDVFEAKRKEREWYENLNSNLNSIYPQRSMKEYYTDNRERILTNVHNYANNHKVEISERGKLRRVSHKEENSIRRSKRITCECGKEINLDHKSRHIKSKFHNDNLKE